ncbi:MAG: hypothetical protein AAGF99_06570 [Bacteroidota bacterium]
MPLDSFPDAGSTREISLGDDEANSPDDVVRSLRQTTGAASPAYY